ncbi:hypothetical protein BK726_27410 [Bacillus thuringiensis serovar londrina]|uniref:hypothetical protein n=1 Tax=Bacillus thuringiensis TaxID=1428 RepID=UPI000B4473ED|nr:hypothetical protein [Bacillus thuringiensis]OTX80804.1 hypothetical protein BK726_27410 [Bacillus thuringiensis serovar londrina]
MEKRKRKSKGIWDAAKIPIYTSIIALLISFASFWVAYNNFTYTKALNEEKIQEKLNLKVSVSRDLNYLTSFIKLMKINYNERTFLGVIPINYECILVNDSQVPMSISNYEVKALLNTKKTVEYSRLDSGLYDEKNSPISFPIDLAPGTSKKFILKVGTLIPENVYETLSKIYKEGNSISYGELQQYLYENGTDVIGNKVEYNQITTIDNKYDEGYALIFHTSKNKQFYKEFSMYQLFE